MEEFDPVRHVIGSSIILEDDFTWPSFYEASVHSFNFLRGDLRPDDNVWIMPTI